MRSVNEVLVEHASEFRSLVLNKTCVGRVGTHAAQSVKSQKSVAWPACWIGQKPPDNGSNKFKNQQRIPVLIIKAE